MLIHKLVSLSLYPLFCYHVIIRMQIEMVCIKLLLINLESAIITIFFSFQLVNTSIFVQHDDIFLMEVTYACVVVIFN